MKRIRLESIGEGELSTGTGALMALAVIWLLVEYGHRRLSS